MMLNDMCEFRVGAVKAPANFTYVNVVESKTQHEIPMKNSTPNKSNSTILVLHFHFSKNKFFK